MQMFLARGIICKDAYLVDNEFVEDVRIVMADTIDGAIKKYTKYWEDQSEPYGIRYRIHEVIVTATIF